MMVRRNPFFMRFSERLGSDANFLKLFSPGVLDVFPPSTIWETTNVIRSSPGGGKTSLLRLFTPNSLLALHAHANLPPYDELYTRLRELDAIQDEGPTVLGAMISCAHDFSYLEDLPLEDVQKERLFISLLNARIVLSILRSALTMQRYKFPDDVKKIQLSCAPGIELPKGIPVQGTGSDYYAWARQLEEDICKEIDSVLPFTKAIPGHGTLFSLWLVNSESLLCDGARIAKRVAVMLDDVHELAPRQRKKLISLISATRSPTQLWIAERLEALSTEDWFSEGNKEGRERNTIYLELHWREHHSRFEKFAGNVADRRTDSASEGQITSFAGCLSDVIEPTEIERRLSGAIDKQVSRIRERAGSTRKYNEWISLKEEVKGSPYDQLVEWRSLEILIERDLQKRQKTFDFYELTEEELQANEKSNVRTGAQLFMNKELKLPYYYGFSRLCRMASSNIDQFLALSGNLFEVITSASILSLSRAVPRINAERQEKILKQAIDKKWREITQMVPNASDVRCLLEGIGNLCQVETYKPTAPYAPGVTGIAILMSDREKLKNPEILERNELYMRLANAIATCLANNLLEGRLNHKCKGREWMVLYLNRMFCVHFDLPLDYGGFREKSLDDLCEWIGKGSSESRKQETAAWF
ncbi:MAG: hypothetical protein ISS54_04350 [Dehalococcoidia bacterium]|nr:hypothetical protein [Dehalococcoidia bacterium]